MLNCLMDFLIEEDFDKPVKKEEFIDLIIVVYLFFVIVGKASHKFVKKERLTCFMLVFFVHFIYIALT